MPDYKLSCIVLLFQDKTLQQVADIASVPSIDQLNIKIRKSLKGHNAKVVCLDWCSDKRHLVSSAQDGKLIVWVSSIILCMCKSPSVNSLSQSKVEQVHITKIKAVI